MKLLFTLAITLTLQLGTHAQTAQWAKKFGANPFDRGYAIAVDAVGNSYVTGYFSNTVTFGGTTLSTTGGSDVFVAKLDSSGDVVWAVKAGSTESLDRGFGISVDASGNCYITGSFSAVANFGGITLTAVGNTDAFIAKLDAAGNFLWAESFGGTAGDEGSAIVNDGDGSAYVAGSFSGTIVLGSTTLSSNTTDVFITKLDTDGNYIWARRGGSPQADEARAITLDAAGNCFVTGDFGSAGNPGATATFGSGHLSSAGGRDVFVTKLGADGTYLWAIQAGGGSDDSGMGISTDAAGNAYLTGYFTGTADFGEHELSSSSAGEKDIFVAKLSSAGAWEWVTRAGGSAHDGGTAIATDAEGRSVVSGTFGDTVTFGTTEVTAVSAGEVFIAEVDAAGAIISAYAIGGSPNELRNGALARDAAGDVHLTGWFRSTVDLGGTELTAAGNNDDIFVVKLARGPAAVHEVVARSEVSAYPNPVRTLLHIRSDAPIKRVEIHNAVGALMRTEVRTVFSVEDLPAGVYLVQVLTKAGLWTTRMLKE